MEKEKEKEILRKIEVCRQCKWFSKEAACWFANGNYACMLDMTMTNGNLVLAKFARDEDDYGKFTVSEHCPYWTEQFVLNWNEEEIKEKAE